MTTIPTTILFVRRFLADYARNPVNLLVLVQAVTAGWAAGFVAAIAMYFQVAAARDTDRRLVIAGLPTTRLVGARLASGLAGVSGDHGCLMPSGWPTLMRFCWWHAGLVLDRAAVLVYDLNLWRACTRRRSAARRTGTCARWPVSAAGRRWSRSGMWA